MTDAIRDAEGMDVKGRSDKKLFSDWFDPYNLKHLRAYNHLQKHGAWPEGFKPKDIKMDVYWHSKIINKMAEAWIKINLPSQTT